MHEQLDCTLLTDSVICDSRLFLETITAYQQEDLSGNSHGASGTITSGISSIMKRWTTKPAAGSSSSSSSSSISSIYSTNSISQSASSRDLDVAYLSLLNKISDTENKLRLHISSMAEEKEKARNKIHKLHAKLYNCMNYSTTQVTTCDDQIDAVRGTLDGISDDLSRVKAMIVFEEELQRQLMVEQSASGLSYFSSRQVTSTGGKVSSIYDDFYGDDDYQEDHLMRTEMNSSSSNSTTANLQGDLANLRSLRDRYVQGLQTLLEHKELCLHVLDSCEQLNDTHILKRDETHQRADSRLVSDSSSNSIYDIPRCLQVITSINRNIAVINRLQGETAGSTHRLQTLIEIREKIIEIATSKSLHLHMDGNDDRDVELGTNSISLPSATSVNSEYNNSSSAFSM